MAFDFLWTKEETLTEEQCQDLIDKFEESSNKIKLEDLEITHGAEVPDLVNLPITEDPAYHGISRVMFGILTSLLEEYKSSLDVNPWGEFGITTGLLMQRLDPGVDTPWRSDFTVDLVNGYVSTHTYMWFLSDFDEGEGAIELSGGEKIYPKKGKFLIYPADYSHLHKHYSPKVGSRYVCLGGLFKSVKMPQTTEQVNDFTL